MTQREGGVSCRTHIPANHVRLVALLPALLCAGSIWAGVDGDRDATPARQPGPAHACPADNDMSGLLGHLDHLAAQMAAEVAPCPGIIAENPEPGPRRDIMAVCDAAGELRDRIRARAALCGRLDAAAEEASLASAIIASKDRQLSMAASTAGTYKTEWESLLDQRKARGRSAFGFTVGVCVSVPFSSVEAGDDLLFTGSGCWGWRLP